MLKTSETKLIGKWQQHDNTFTHDDTCRRIDFLVNNYLLKIGSREDGWAILFKDPIDMRLWELTYPNSHIHGGGPPSLCCIPLLDAKTRYGNFM